ncbi:hypothetical protein ACFL3C_03820 [Patescibacteria group bacterium]
MDIGGEEAPTTILQEDGDLPLEDLTPVADKADKIATIHAIGERPMTIQQEEDKQLIRRLNSAFSKAEEIQRQHPTGKEFVSILRGKATPEQDIHLEHCPLCKAQLDDMRRLVKSEHLKVFLKERGYR